MNLSEVKTNKSCIVLNIKIPNKELNLRIMELGITKGVKIAVKSRSLLKKTLIIVFNNSCFTISTSIANCIEVKYE